MKEMGSKKKIGCDWGEKYKEVASATKSATKNVIVPSKSGQHRVKMVYDGKLM